MFESKSRAISAEEVEVKVQDTTELINSRANDVATWDMPSSLEVFSDRLNLMFDDIGTYLVPTDPIPDSLARKYNNLKNIKEQLEEEKRKKDPRDDNFCREFCSIVADFISEVSDLLGKFASKFVQAGSSAIRAATFAVGIFLGPLGKLLAPVVAEKLVSTYYDACAYLARMYERYCRRLVSWAQNMCERLCLYFRGDGGPPTDGHISCTG